MSEERRRKERSDSEKREEIVNNFMGKNKEKRAEAFALAREPDNADTILFKELEERLKPIIVQNSEEIKESVLEEYTRKQAAGQLRPGQIMHQVVLPDFCCNNSVRKKLMSFAEELQARFSDISKKDIYLSLLFSYYALGLLEHTQQNFLLHHDIFQLADVDGAIVYLTNGIMAGDIQDETGANISKKIRRMALGMLGGKKKTKRYRKTRRYRKSRKSRRKHRL
jgi:hypothetical protein